MKNSKKYIIIIVGLIIVIGIILFFINSNKMRKEEVEENNGITDTETPVEFVRGDFTEATEQEYYFVSDYMTNFLNALAFESNDVAYELIDKNYAKQKEITKENIISNLKFSNKYQEFEATSIYNWDLTKSMEIYIVKGIVREKDSEDGIKKEFEAILNVDNENSTFSITPYEVGTLDIEKLDADELIKNTVSIDKNNSNQFIISVTNQKIKASKLFNKYISETLYYTNDAYEMLDEEYKNKRFGSIEKYKAYVTENQSFIKELVIESYAVSKKEGHTEYSIMDNYGNIYTFNVTNLLNYTVKMDDYTIPTEEFLQQYSSANVQEQVSLNIGKFFSMLNAKDYDSAYNCLAEGFKQNYFPTVEDFKKYAEENFFKGNKLEGVSFENEGVTYMLTVKISDYRGIDTKVVEKTIIMQLNEGTDFVMSFNVE